MKKIFLPVLSAFLLLLVSCTGKEVARVPVTPVAEGESENFQSSEPVPLKKGEKVSYWTELGLEYSGDLQLQYTIDVTKDGESISKMNYDPTQKSVTIGESNVTIGGHTKWKFTGRFGSFTAPADGNYTFNVMLIHSDNPDCEISHSVFLLKK